MVRSATRLLVACVAVALGASASARKLEKGDPAPEFAAEKWRHAPRAAQPSLESLADKVIRHEFRRTWCAPCLRSMRKIQQLHVRAADRGVALLAISYAKPEVREPFLIKNRYPFLSCSDLKKTIIGTYPLKGWPRGVVIDAAGTVVHDGSPYEAESVIQPRLEGAIRSRRTSVETCDGHLHFISESFPSREAVKK